MLVAKVETKRPQKRQVKNIINTKYEKLSFFLFGLSIGFNVAFLYVLFTRL